MKPHQCSFEHLVVPLQMKNEKTNANATIVIDYKVILDIDNGLPVLFHHVLHHRFVIDDHGLIISCKTYIEHRCCIR